MKQKLVSVIIVNWNGLQWLLDCFKSLLEQRYKNIEIIFIDNASTDGSVAWVKKHYPKTKILVNDRNIGFSDANNFGYREAKGQYILFLNNDTIVTKNFLVEMIAAVERSQEIGGAQSKILLMDNKDTHDSVGAFLTPTGFLFHYGFKKKDEKKFDSQIDLYTAKGACMLFRKSVLDAVSVDGNIFDPAYFAYFEETDMCHRVWLSGFRIVYAYKSVIYHKMGGTSSSMNNAFVQYHSFKNRINSYVKNLGTLNLLKLMTLHLLLAIGMAWFNLLKGNIGLWIAIHNAIVWNIRTWKKSLADRKYIQTYIRRRTDSELFPVIMKHPKIRYYLSFLSGRYDYEE